LENHIRRHFNYRPFKCNYCEKSFKTRQYLTGHINGVHKNDKQFVCDKCDARFSWRTTWKRHMQNHVLKANKKKNKKNGGTSTATNAGGLINLSTDTTNALSIKSNTLNVRNAVLNVHSPSTGTSVQNLHDSFTQQNVLQFSQAMPTHLTNETFALHHPQLTAITHLTPAHLQQGVTQLTQAHLTQGQLPHGLTQLPQVITQLPQGVTHLPQGVTHLQQGVNLLSHSLSIPHVQLQQSLANLNQNQLPLYTVSQQQQITNQLQPTLAQLQQPSVQTIEQLTHQNIDTS